MRVFLDTNVLVAALTTRGLCSDVVRTVVSAHTLVTAEAVLEELSRVLQAKMEVPATLVAEAVALLRRHGEVGHETLRRLPRVRDKNDVAVLAGAVAGRADLLVTGDQDLLSLRRVGRMRIVDPRGFWRLITRG